MKEEERRRGGAGEYLVRDDQPLFSIDWASSVSGSSFSASSSKSASSSTFRNPRRRGWSGNQTTGQAMDISLKPINHYT